MSVLRDVTSRPACLLSAFGGVDGKKKLQAAAYYFLKAFGLRQGSLYVNGKMVDLEGPTFNVFQVRFGLVWFVFFWLHGGVALLIFQVCVSCQRQTLEKASFGGFMEPSCG